MKKQISTLVVVSAILLTACGAGLSVQPTATLALPTATLPPTLTSTPEPTFTPTTTPTPRLPVSLGTQIPDPGVSLSADNIGRSAELAHWGKGVITGGVYSPDGNHIAVASTLGVSIYQADTLDEIVYFETTASINSIAFSPGGDTLATGLIDNTVGIWDPSDGTLLNSFENQETEGDSGDVQVNAVAFSPDGKLLVSGFSDGTINLWRVSDGSLVNTLRNHLRDVTSVFFSPDGQAVFSASKDGKVRMINVSDGKTIQTFAGQYITDATISTDGKTLATYDHPVNKYEGNLILWDVQSGKELKSMVGGDDSVDITGVVLSPDGLLVAAALEDYSVKIWSVTSGIAQNTFEDLQPKDGWYYLADFTVAFSPDGQSFFMAGSNVIGTWDFKKSTLLKSSTIKSQSIIDVALSPDGEILASVEGPNVSLLNISDGTLITTNESIQSNGSVDFSPDGTTLAVAMFDRTVQLWPLSDNGLRRSFEPGAGAGNIQQIWKVAFSPDGETLAVGMDGYPTVKIELLQVSDGALLRTMAPGIQYAYPIEAIFSPDGQFLAAAYGDQLKLYQVSDGKPVRAYTSVYRPAFSADGTLLAAAGTADNSWRMWKVPSGDNVFSIKDRPNRIISLVFSPDNAMVVTGSIDGTIEVFLVSDGTLITSWRGHSRGVSDVIFTSDGKYLISGSYDGTIRMWGIKP